MSTTTASSSTYYTVIGLEVHIQLETRTKIFCGCSTDPTDGTGPNTRTCPVCLGLPGALPMLNEAAVEAAIKVGKALHSTIPEETSFHRKNYYYPDLPKNFQITQYDAPICDGGELTFTVEDTRRTIGIERAHLEEDPGSLMHAGGSIDTATHTLIDYNRAGTPLLEIVTSPDFRSPSEVRAFLAKLEEVLEYLGVFDASRDGSLRVDANLSIIEGSEDQSQYDLSPEALEAANRTEVKNISSHKGAEKALAYEETRQKNALKRGQGIQQETRHWDESRGVTVSMRSKEQEADYRYFSEGDLPPLRVSHWMDEIEIPELPDVRRNRFQHEYGLDPESASKLTTTKQTADFFERVTAEFQPQLAATWVADNLLGELNYRDMTIEDVTDRLDEFIRLIELVDEQEITVKNAEEIVLREMLDSGRDPDSIVSDEGLGKTETYEIEEIVETVINEHPDAVSDFEAGEEGALNYLVGQVMQQTRGRADPADVNSLLQDRLA